MALILIVDDEHSVRQVLARWIQGAGHEIVEAESADAALQVMEKQPAAVVFSDIQMPRHDGLWLTAELRKRYQKSDRKSTRLNSSHIQKSRMPSSA